MNKIFINRLNILFRIKDLFIIFFNVDVHRLRALINQFLGFDCLF